eukprot:scaffold54632_cov60-Phaeocystis_antarctica.AAC.1
MPSPGQEQYSGGQSTAALSLRRAPWGPPRAPRLESRSSALSASATAIWEYRQLTVHHSAVTRPGSRVVQALSLPPVTLPPGMVSRVGSTSMDVPSANLRTVGARFLRNFSNEWCAR